MGVKKTIIIFCLIQNKLRISVLLETALYFILLEHEL